MFHKKNKKQQKKTVSRVKLTFFMFLKDVSTETSISSKIDISLETLFLFCFFVFVHETFVVFEIKRSERKKQKN